MQLTFIGPLLLLSSSKAFISHERVQNKYLSNKNNVNIAMSGEDLFENQQTTITDFIAKNEILEKQELPILNKDKFYTKAIGFITKCSEPVSAELLKKSFILGLVSSFSESGMQQALGIFTSNSALSTIKSLAICTLSRTLYIAQATQVVNLSEIQSKEIISSKHLKINSVFKTGLEIGLGSILAASVIFVPWMVVLDSQKNVLGLIQGTQRTKIAMRNCFHIQKFLGLVKVCATTLFLKTLFKSNSLKTSIPMATIKTVFTAKPEQALRAGLEAGQTYNPKFLFWYFIQQLMFYIGLNLSKK